MTNDEIGQLIAAEMDKFGWDIANLRVAPWHPWGDAGPGEVLEGIITTVIVDTMLVMKGVATPDLALA